MSEKDVKDASAGVLQDLKRFQKDKEADLRRYMVCTAPTWYASLVSSLIAFRSRMLVAIWTGLGRISRRGPKPRTK